MNDMARRYACLRIALLFIFANRADDSGSLAGERRERGLASATTVTSACLSVFAAFATIALAATVTAFAATVTAAAAWTMSENVVVYIRCVLCPCLPTPALARSPGT